ncbi:MAG: hypothetical protein ACJ8NR_01830 [Sulfurifustis sp.]
MDTNQNGHRSFERRRTICTAARAATFVTIHARRVQPHGVFSARLFLGYYYAPALTAAASTDSVVKKLLSTREP